MSLALTVKFPSFEPKGKAGLAALPFFLSLALLGLLGWEALFAPPGLPLHDEGAADHVGMLLAVAQVPLIILGFLLRVRQPRAAFLLAALQSLSLALVLGLVMLAEAHARDDVRVRIEAARPFPGGEQAVRSFVTAPATTDASSAVRGFLQRDGDRLAHEIDGLGAVEAVEFAGIDNIGWDVYAVTFDKGVRHMHLFLAGDGRLLGVALADASSGCLSSEVYDCRYLGRPFRGVNAGR
jgi:hypothetical protein